MAADEVCSMTRLKEHNSPFAGVCQDYEVWGGRGERVAGRLCRSGGAHPGASSAAYDPAQVVNDALTCLDAELEALHTDFCYPSAPPGRLIRACLIPILFSVRSERQLMEQLQYSFLFRWFTDPGIDGPVGCTPFSSRTTTDC